MAVTGQQSIGAAKPVVASDGDDTLRCCNRLTFLLEPCRRKAGTMPTKSCNQRCWRWRWWAPMLQPAGYFAGTMLAKSWNHAGEKLQPALPAMEIAGYHVLLFDGTSVSDFCYHRLQFLLPLSSIFATTLFLIFCWMHLEPFSIFFVTTVFVLCYHRC